VGIVQAGPGLDKDKPLKGINSAIGPYFAAGTRLTAYKKGNFRFDFVLKLETDKKRTG